MSVRPVRYVRGLAGRLDGQRLTENVAFALYGGCVAAWYIAQNPTPEPMAYAGGLAITSTLLFVGLVAWVYWGDG